MDFELTEEHRMLKDLVARFVRDELMPLEAGVLEREAAGQGLVWPTKNADASTRSPRAGPLGPGRAGGRRRRRPAARWPWSASTRSWAGPSRPTPCRRTRRTCAC